MKIIQLLLLLLSFSLFSQTNPLKKQTSLENKIEFTIYPNPVKGIVNVYCEQKIDYIKLYNKHGKPVFKSKLKDNKIDLTQLEDGFYLFCAYINGKRIKKGILKKT